MRLQVSCIFSWAVNEFKLEDNPDSECNSYEASLPNGVMPPNLETFIPAECLPDFIDVSVNYYFLTATCKNWEEEELHSASVRKPIKFVRKYPARTHTDEGSFNPVQISTMVNGDQVISTDQILRLTCQTVTAPKERY